RFGDMENVPNLQSQSIFQDFVTRLKDDGFNVAYSVVDAAAYGLPQRRRRLVLLASRLGPIRLLSPEEIGATPRTVKDSIGGLPAIEAGETYSADPLHKARALTKINIQRIAASRPGGTWLDWPSHLKLACHQKESGSTFKSVYGRLEWDKPSGTITTQSSNFGTGRFGHPEQNRALSLREMAILQSFPADYQFVKSEEEADFTSIGRLIGNAVPVELGYAVGLSIKSHLHAIR
ncbi:DNA cytosine methyltransferase, partial [Herbaspirillum sp. B65]|uniref:DNA cytosine methyltransferase n=1 Tax=Herbaspirillum sp. B65 TaxID=137708 RepID=UPI0011D27EFD